MDIGKHLGTFNLFRENDGTLWVTCAGAQGVREELGESWEGPTHTMAMLALYEGVRQMQERANKADDKG